MFKFLKEKIKSWVSKTKEEATTDETPKKTKHIKKKAPKDKKIKEELKKAKKKAEKLKKEEKKREKQKKKEETKEEVKEESKQEIKEEPEQDTKDSTMGEAKSLASATANEERGGATKNKVTETQMQDSEVGGHIPEDVEQEIEPQEIEEPQPEEPKEKKSFFSAFKKKLTNEKFDELFQELELILLQNNVAVEVVNKIRLKLAEELVGKNLSDVNLEEKLKEAIESVLIKPLDFKKEIEKILAVKRPVVILFVGINGSGKTTTIAKLAHYLKKQKYSVCLAAGDTFRAASIEQLQKHADNLKVELIKKEYNSDPASVGFDAIQHAKKHHIDIVLIDTAGRMQNKDSLMRELEKIERVNKPDFRIFVGESITGNDATEQASSFNESIALDGIILSKADVDEKGGTAISVSYVTKKPILFLGTGQTYDDLEVFDKKKILDKLF